MSPTHNELLASFVIIINVGLSGATLHRQGLTNICPRMSRVLFHISIVLPGHGRHDSTMSISIFKTSKDYLWCMFDISDKDLFQFF